MDIVFDIIPGCTNVLLPVKIVEFFVVTKFVFLANYNLCQRLSQCINDYHIF